MLSLKFFSLRFETLFELSTINLSRPFSIIRSGSVRSVLCCLRTRLTPIISHQNFRNEFTLFLTANSFDNEATDRNDYEKYCDYDENPDR